MDFEIGTLFRALKKVAQGMHRCSIGACPADEATVKFANFSRRSHAQNAFWAVFRFRSFGPLPGPGRILLDRGGWGFPWCLLLNNGGAIDFRKSQVCLLLNNGGRNRFQKIATLLAFEQRGGAINFRRSQVCLLLNNGGQNPPNLKIVLTIIQGMDSEVLKQFPSFPGGF